MITMRMSGLPRTCTLCRVSHDVAQPGTLLGAHMRVWGWLLGVTLVWGMLLLTTQPAAAQSFQIYVPMVATDESGGPGGSGEEPEVCALNAEEQAVADLMVNDPNQQRVNPVCNSILAQVARARARDMAQRNYFSHTNPDGIGPNYLVRQMGYVLPDWYNNNPDGNNIESIGAGYNSPTALWEAWRRSEGHRVHVLGESDFWAEQRAYGVGYYFDPNSTYKHYWVFLSAPIAE